MAVAEAEATARPRRIVVFGRGLGVFAGWCLMALAGGRGQPAAEGFHRETETYDCAGPEAACALAPLVVALVLIVWFCFFVIVLGFWLFLPIGLAVLAVVVATPIRSGLLAGNLAAAAGVWGGFLVLLLAGAS